MLVEKNLPNIECYKYKFDTSIGFNNCLYFVEILSIVQDSFDYSSDSSASVYSK